MKKVTVVLLAVLCLATFAFAGDATPKSKAGDKAWLFSFNGLSTLGAGSYGGGVGAKYYFQDDMALRFGLGFNYGGSTVKGTGGNPDVKSSNTSFSLMPALTYTFASAGSVSSYVGGQVGLSMTSNTSGDDGTNKVVTSTTSFGIGALAGFEWFCYDGISLGAEYSLMFSTGSGKTETTTSGGTVSVDAPTTTSFGIQNAGNLTLSVYF